LVPFFIYNEVFMTGFLQYVLDISESLRTNILSDKIKSSGYDFRISEKDEDDKSSIRTVYITSTGYGIATNLASKDDVPEDFVVTLKYYNNSYDEHDMFFIINSSGIAFHFRGEVYEDIQKDEYFNLTMCFSNKMISFDEIKGIHNNLDKLVGFTLYYAQDEEKQYGY